MLGFQWVNGGEALILRVLLQNASSGQGLTGLDENTSDLVISTIADNSHTPAVYTANGNTIDGIGTLGQIASITATHCNFAEVDDTHHPGLYEIQFADSTWSESDARYVIVSVNGASGLRHFSTLVQLSSVPADLRMIGGEEPSNAELSLRSLVIYKDDGPALTIGGGNVASVLISGAGDGVPAIVASGQNAPGFIVLNTSSEANSLPAMTVGINGASGTGPALKLSASNTGNGIEVLGGATSGDAVKLSTTDGDGLVINSAGSGKVDVNATLSDSAGIASILSDTAEILTDIGTTGVVVATGSKNGYALSSAYDLYHADIQFTRDEVHDQDEYTVTWFKNGVRITSDIDDPMIQVVKREDGLDLVEAVEMDPIGMTGSYKHDEDEVENRIVNGEAVIVIVSAYIDDATRSFARLVGRDAA